MSLTRPRRSPRGTPIVRHVPELDDRSRPSLPLQVHHSARTRGLRPARYSTRRQNSRLKLLKRERRIDALSVLLGTTPYFLGDHPSSIDATVFALTLALLAPPGENPLKQRAAGHANLVAYTGRMNRRYFEHPPGRSVESPEATAWSMCWRMNPPSRSIARRASGKKRKICHTWIMRSQTSSSA